MKTKNRGSNRCTKLTQTTASASNTHAIFEPGAWKQVRGQLVSVVHQYVLSKWFENWGTWGCRLVVIAIFYLVYTPVSYICPQLYPNENVRTEVTMYSHPFHIFLQSVRHFSHKIFVAGLFSRWDSVNPCYLKHFWVVILKEEFGSLHQRGLVESLWFLQCYNRLLIWIQNHAQAGKFILPSVTKNIIQQNMLLHRRMSVVMISLMCSHARLKRSLWGGYGCSIQKPRNKG